MPAPIRPEIAEPMKGIARTIAGCLPPTHGFCLLIFDFGQGGHTSYMSNAKREDMLRLLREFIVMLERDTV